MKISNYALLFILLIGVEISLQLVQSGILLVPVEMHLEEDHKEGQKDDIKKFQNTFKFISSQQSLLINAAKKQKGYISYQPNLFAQFIRDTVTPPPEQ